MHRFPAVLRDSAAGDKSHYWCTHLNFNEDWIMQPLNAAFKCTRTMQQWCMLGKSGMISCWWRPVLFVSQSQLLPYAAFLPDVLSFNHRQDKYPGVCETGCLSFTVTTEKRAERGLIAFVTLLLLILSCVCIISRVISTTGFRFESPCSNFLSYIVSLILEMSDKSNYYDLFRSRNDLI